MFFSQAAIHSIIVSVGILRILGGFGKFWEILGFCRCGTSHFQRPTACCITPSPLPTPLKASHSFSLLPLPDCGVLQVFCGLSWMHFVFCKTHSEGVYDCTRPSEHRSKAQNAPREPQNKKKPPTAVTIEGSK